MMIEHKFNVPKGFNPHQHMDGIKAKIKEITGVEANITPLRPQAPGYNGTTYVITGDGLRISIRHDPDAFRVEREGLGIYMNADSNEEGLYEAILNILGLKRQS